jgi:NAD(P)-dependent dehydrogenase (short-subunit alcohol dehydrogenase family)
LAGFLFLILSWRKPGLILFKIKTEQGINKMGKLEGKIALVTGGSEGIGLATAKEFVAEGAYVFITGRRQPELDSAVKEIGKNVSAIKGDVANNDDLDALYDTIEKEKGKLDIVFANAGGGEFLELENITEEHFDKWFGINVKGLLFTVQKGVRLMKDGGSVILNGSVAGSTGMPAFGVYNATKAAVRSFARSWTNDLKGRNIRVNVVSPGPIDTPAIGKIAEDKAEEFKSQIIAAVPQGRIGQPSEIAKPVVFLASDDSSFVSGIELFVDGGMAQV